MNFDGNDFDGNLCEVNSKILEEFPGEAQNCSDNMFILKSYIGSKHKIMHLRDTVRYTLFFEPCNLILKVFQDFVFTYFKQDRPHVNDF